MKTLIIEDTKLIGLMMQEVLSQYGICDLAFDPIDGFNKYANSVQYKCPYDLICLDIIMPIYNGYQILEKIRNYEKFAKVNKAAIVVMVSGLDSNYNRQKAFDLGADGYLIKPFDIRDLNALLKEKGLTIEAKE
jgi:two-component system, chemotaxis family, chemotaxis protein CheY